MDEDIFCVIRMFNAHTEFDKGERAVELLALPSQPYIVYQPQPKTWNGAYETIYFQTIISHL